MFRAIFSACLLVISMHAQADFYTWLSALKQEARTRGISQATLDSALNGLEIAPRVVELDRKQPEFIESFSTYLGRHVTSRLVTRGQILLNEHRALFDEVEQRYGVPREILAAFWGLETQYGSTTGNVSIPTALATLAFDGRRSAFFRAELFDALALIDAGHVTAANMRGSWAGAMGQMQFMPSTYRRYAVDGDHDGRINLWSSLPDVLHSAGNYLREAGWKAGEPAAFEVRLPTDFEGRYARLYYRRPLAEWQAATVVSVSGKAFPKQPTAAAIILPEGLRGPAFMVFDNFDVIMQWNRSINYALSVTLLAEQLAGNGRLPSRTNVEALSNTQLISLQQQLTEMGFDAGAADGLPGVKTQTAIRRYQSAQNLPIDGYPSPELLVQVEQRYKVVSQAGLIKARVVDPTFSDVNP